MIGMSPFRPGASTGDQSNSIGGYPHSGQGDPSGIGPKQQVQMLQAQRAKSTHGLGGIGRRPPEQLDNYGERAIPGSAQKTTEPGAGFGGLKGLLRF